MCLTSKTEIGNLHRISWRGGRRSNEVRVAAKGRVVRGGCRNEDVLGFDIAMEEVVGVDMVETLQDLVEDTLDVLSLEIFVVPCLHQLIEIAIHVLHGDVKLAGERIEENIKGRNKVRMRRKSPQEDYLPQLQAWS
jgi:hypothetical protein